MGGGERGGGGYACCMTLMSCNVSRCKQRKNTKICCMANMLHASCFSISMANIYLCGKINVALHMIYATCFTV